MIQEDSNTYRQYGDINDENSCSIAPYPQQLHQNNSFINKVHSIVDRINHDIIGQYQPFITPFGKKPIIYADWTASGRALKSIEDYLLNHIIPYYGNTHTTTSITGHQSTCYRHEARQIIAESVNAKITGKAAEDVVLFIGNGTTAAVDKLIHIFGLNLPMPEDSVDINLKPIIFVSSFEHHSNLLPWRESVADVVTIAYNIDTGIDLIDLEHQLQTYQHRNLKIGAFSACSNVTGICTDVCEVSILLHRYNALSIFDYATAAPYVKIDMNPTSLSSLAYKDAIYFSGHKFLGGPGSPGVLVLKKKLLPQSNETPSSTVGGGTVFYVTDHHHRYLSNREEREEGGTPSVLSDVKLGLVMHLKQSIPSLWIEEEELRISHYVTEKLQSHKAIVLLGRRSTIETNKCKSKYLPIFSFLIRCQDRFLHFHFVAALLNDLFGIQARGGCMCAGPFSQSLLGISAEENQEIEKFLLEKHEVYRPGYTRLSFPYWLSQYEIDYIVDAILFVANYGYLFLSLYRYNHKTGEWAHTTRLTRFPERKWISNYNILLNSSNFNNNNNNNSNSSSSSSNVACSNLSEDRIEKNDAMETNVINDHYSKNNVIDYNSFIQQWDVSTIKELFEITNKNVFIELEKLQQVAMKSQNKRLHNNNPQSSILNINEESFERLRWFVSFEDLNLNPSELITLKGPIQPTFVEDLAKLQRNLDHTQEYIDYSTGLNNHIGADNVLNRSRDATSTITASVSAYVIKRDQKLLSHTGSEERIPRYLKKFDPVKTQLGYTSTATTSNTITNNTTNASSSNTSNCSIFPLLANVINKVQLSQPCVDLTATKSNATTATTILVPDTTTAQSHDLVECNNPINDDSGTNTSNANKVLSGSGLFYAGNPNVSLKFHLPPKKIMKQVGQAIKEWNMIEDGDRLLLGLSGGKDSLALLHILLALQKRAPVSFTIACATVDPQTDSFDPSPLIPYVQSLGITYHYLSEPIVELAKSKLQGDSLCAFCSRFKRGLLYSCCRNYNYNKLVLAQHLDDLVESFLMSALHNGQIRTMKANYNIEAGDVKVIRPLIYIREKSTRDFSQTSGLPIINENCPACFEQPKERARIKKLMSQEETMIPNLYFNLKKALIPLMHDDTYTAMNKITNQIEITSNMQLNKDQIIESIHRKRQLKDGSNTNIDINIIDNIYITNSNQDEDDFHSDHLKKLKTEKNTEISCTDSYCVPCYELA